ncbi:MAG: peptidase [Proteobacteria bacterium]|nr:peptidase [Pseudomonadota bacterium]
MNNNEHKNFYRLAILLGAVFIANCGGGSPPPVSGWVSGVFLPSGTFSSHCASPRSGVDANGRPFPDVQGSTLDQNNWLRSWSDELYLWYSEIIDRDPAGFQTLDYFDLLKTFATTPSGTDKDQFHFTFPTDEWLALSQGGVSAGYGMNLSFISSVPPRNVVVAFTDPGSPAEGNIARGAMLLEVDGFDLVNDNTSAGIDALNAGLFPAGINESHSFTVLDFGAASSRTFDMVSANVVSTPVQKVSTIWTITGDVGYMLFNDHIATAEQGLIDAINFLQAANIDDLVIDLRYNGGGFLDIASELAFMIAGPVPTAGQTFEKIVFSDKHPVTNPVTGQSLTPIPFHTTSQGFSAPAGQALPTLNLPRVFLLTGPNTCSASESIINSLQGVDFEVIQIGSTTCGKPFGFFPDDNCGTTYFSIQFQGLNAKNFGDFTDGFSPTNSTGTVGALVPGCSVADDFSAALGDSTEGRLAAALNYRDTQSCPMPSGTTQKLALSGPGTFSLDAVDGLVPKSPWLENKIIVR